jgi:hypothetical protein
MRRSSCDVYVRLRPGRGVLLIVPRVFVVLIEVATGDFGRDSDNVIRGEVNHQTCIFLLLYSITHAMSELQPQQHAYSEADIQAAILAYNTGEHSSIRAAARAFSVPYPTLRNRLSGRTSRLHAHETSQILSNAEEGTLVRWITCLTRTGFPASPALVVEMAEEIRNGRFQLSQTPSPQRSIGKPWVDRFRTRHSEIQSTWTR